MEVGVSGNRRPVVLVLTSLMLIVLSCSEKEMPTQPAVSSPAAAGSASSEAVASGTARSSRGRGTVKVDPREGRDDNKTPSPTVTGTPPTPTATRTPENEREERTKTPTVTGTPPTATATRTPEVEPEERTKTPTPTPGTPTGTVTPSSPTPTRTPEQENENEKEVEGTVGTINGASFTVMTKSGPVTIQTNAATQFRGDGATKSLADVKSGLEVEVKGQLQPDASILASRVDIKND